MRCWQIPRLKRSFSDNERRIYYRTISFQRRAQEVEDWHERLDQGTWMSNKRMQRIWTKFRKNRTALRNMRTPEFFTYMEDYFDQPHQQNMILIEKAFRQIDDILCRRYTFEPRDPNFHPRRG